MFFKNFFPILFALSLFSCSSQQNGTQVLVKNKVELEKAIEGATPGEEIVLANGVWSDVQINFWGQGTKEHPITLRAETPGKVYIEGESFLKFGGDYLIAKDLYFRNGHTPSDAVVEFRTKEKVANHCTFTNCVIENFNQPQRSTQDFWVEFWGRHNELSNCNIIGKSNSGPTIRVQPKGNESINNYHRIVNNHFGPRPRKGGPHGETIQIGDSETSMNPSYTMVSNNLFDHCDGEVEVISNKSNFNEYRSNVFYKCEGSLVMRHGNYCIIDGNYFIGDSADAYMGGIRIINTGHWVTNNYFYNLKGANFRSPLSVMNGVPKSPMNRYNQVTDVVVAYNTWVNCKSPWQFSVGANLDQKGILPASEIRSARPKRTVIADNLVYTNDPKSPAIIAYDKLDGISFKNNFINNKSLANQIPNTFNYCNFGITKLTDYIYLPSAEVDSLNTYKGFEFDKINTDLLGNSRTGKNRVGAIAEGKVNDPDILNNKKYGSNWFVVDKEAPVSKVIKVTAGDPDLAAKINHANDHDIFELAEGTYTIPASINFGKKLTIRAAGGDNVKLVYTGQEGTPLFQANPFGNLVLENIALVGNGKNYLFATLQKNMSALYQLTVKKCAIRNFNYVLKAYKESFADSILFDGCQISDCTNGIELSAETDDTGDYNVEFLTIDGCKFNNVKSNVIDYYRGGYDESTIGGTLEVLNSVFTNCGAKEKNKILLNNRGILNVEISGNTFKNNPVKLVALLWGAKNNTHSNNDIVNSGKILVQENIKMTLMY